MAFMLLLILLLLFFFVAGLFPPVPTAKIQPFSSADVGVVARGDEWQKWDFIGVRIFSS